MRLPVLLVSFIFLQATFQARAIPFLTNERFVAENPQQPYALVAGGSKGIGFAIAEALAKRGFNLILIARHEDALTDADSVLEKRYGVRVEWLAKDLAYKQSASEIAAWCISHNIRLKMLCNVAGLGGSHDYLSLPLDSLHYMIDLNIGSTMELTLRLLPLLEKNAPSYILNVGSMAGFAPIPSKNMYSATKASVLYFSYSLHYQLMEKNISVSCLTPGPVFTKASIVEDTKKNLGWLGMQMAVSPERVGEVAIRKTLNGKMLIIPGTLPKVMSTLVRIMPRRVITAIYYQVGKKKDKKTKKR